jgi:hypothetical protein
MAAHEIFHVCEGRWMARATCETYRLAEALQASERNLAAERELSKRLLDGITVLATASQNNETRMHWAEADRDAHAAALAAERARVQRVREAVVKDEKVTGWSHDHTRAALAGEGAADLERQTDLPSGQGPELEGEGAADRPQGEPPPLRPDGGCLHCGGVGSACRCYS